MSAFRGSTVLLNLKLVQLVCMTLKVKGEWSRGERGRERGVRGRGKVGGDEGRGKVGGGERRGKVGGDEGREKVGGGEGRGKAERGEGRGKWEGVREGEKWEGVREGEKWEGVREGEKWEGMREGEKWKGKRVGEESGKGKEERGILASMSTTIIPPRPCSHALASCESHRSIIMFIRFWVKLKNNKVMSDKNR